MNSAQHLWSWLAGKKTYLVSVAGVIYAWGIQHALWQNDTLLDAMFAGGLAAALRHGWKSDAAKILAAVVTDPPVLPPVVRVPVDGGTPAAATGVAVKVGVALLCVGLFAGCGGAKLEVGGAYAPTGTNGVATVAPDYAFFVVDSAYELAYSAIDGAFAFERNNRALLWKISPDIKHSLDQVRPQAVEVRNQYAVARAAYLANPTPAGLSALNEVLAKVQQLAATAAAVLPKSPSPMAGMTDATAPQRFRLIHTDNPIHF